MTIKELKEALQGLPDDMPVLLWAPLDTDPIELALHSVHDERANDLYQCTLSTEKE